MAMTFYLDESGHSGDAVNSGDEFDFKGQPFFALAAVGIEDEAFIAARIDELKALHRIPPSELKSKSLTSKSKFVLDVISFLESIDAPILVELVDKRFFIIANIVSFQLTPACMSFPEGASTSYIRNGIADFLCAEAPNELLDIFAQACLEPSDENVLLSFSALQELGEKRRKLVGPVAECLCLMVEDARSEYLELKAGDANAYLQFLPPPDHNKRNKRVWMLPNLTSFTNIYARLNLFFSKKLSGIRIVHDQQLEIEEILQLGKTNAETPKDERPFTPRSDYVFEESATLEFAHSYESIGLQLADVVAGAVMRYFRDSKSGDTHPDLDKAVLQLIRNTNKKPGYGVNQVVASFEVRHA